MTGRRPLSWVQRAVRVELAICLVASGVVSGRRDRLVSLVLALLLLAGVVVLLSAYRGYDWRGRPMSSAESGGPSAMLALLGTVVAIGLITAFAFRAVEPSTSASSTSAAAGEGFAPNIELGVIPRSLEARAPVGVSSTRADYAAYVSRLCAAAAPYQHRLVLDVGILGRGSLAVPRKLLFARAKTASVFDLLSDVVGEEGQLLAVQRPSRRATPPPSEVGVVGRLRAAFTQLVGLEETLSSRYHRIALGWIDDQIPIAHAPARSIAAGTTAAAGLSARILLLERQVGARGCGLVEPAAG